ncbi:hypothetical protein LBMAG42_18880 [Deltaproteobacteria bacterium]|nr:hypothetical protein LBMAG42_18880 [Deltaproteobacteria bacterium]
MVPLSFDVLERELRSLSAPPRDIGVVRKLVRRLPAEGRECPESVVLDADRGLIGDQWAAGKANPEAQVTVMRADVASVMCRGGEYEVLGDNLFVELDTSASNLPPGTRIRVGVVECEVTPKPHTGCHKFSRRVGADALALTRTPEWKPQNLRGVHLRVLRSGRVAVGDAIVVESRP